MSNLAVTPEPAPVRTDSPAVWPLVIRDLDKLDAPLWLIAVLREDMTARHEAGVEKYGVPLQVENGRNHGHDAYQEALDGCAYSRAQAETAGAEGWHDIHGQFILLAAAIRFRLALEQEPKR